VAKESRLVAMVLEGFAVAPQRDRKRENAFLT
jgi:hypothetical protein